MPQGNRSALLEILNRAGKTELARKVQNSITPSFSNQLYENNSINPDIKESPVVEKPQGVLSDEELIQIGRKKAPEMSRFLPDLLQRPSPAFPPFEPTQQPIDLLRGPKATISGIVGTVESMAGGLEWLTNGRIGRDLANKTKEWQKSLQPPDPTFLDAVNSGFGSAGTFFIPGMGVGFGTAKLASISTRLALWLGSGVSAGLEAMSEAGTVYRNVLEETGEKERADKAATMTFWLNLPLIAITNKAGVFGEQANLIARGLVSSGTEALQETLQEAISKSAERKPITVGGLATAGGVGAITGGVVGGATALAFPQTIITPTEKIEKITPSPLTSLDMKLPIPPPSSEPKTKVIEGEQRNISKTEEIPQTSAKELVVEKAKKLTIQQDIDKLIQEGASPELFTEPLTIFDKLKEKGIEHIAITQALRDHFESEEIGMIRKKNVGFFSKKVTPQARPLDEVAKTMDMTVDDLAEALRTAKTRRQALDDIKREIEIQKEEANPPVKVSELELEKGDRFKIAGEDFKVTNKEGETLTIKNKDTFKVAPLKGAEGEIIDFYTGIPVKKLLEPFRWKSKPINDTINLPSELKFSDSKVENAYNNAKYKTPSIFEKGLNWVIKTKESFQRKYVLLDPQQDGVVSNILRVFEANSSISKAETAFILKDFTDGFGEKPMELYKRYIFLADIVQDIKKGLVGKDPNVPLRFQFKSVEQIQQEFEKFKEILEANPNVKNAIERRTKFFKDLAQKQVDLDLLPEEVLGDENYYHHQVLQYMGEKVYPGLSATDVRVKRKGFQIAREGSELDYNTEYLEAEFEVISQSLAQIRTVDTLRRLEQFDITNKLKLQARQQGIENWESLIPDDYTFWQPTKGNIFYPALSISEKIAHDVIEGTSQLTEEDLQQIYAIGKKRVQWVIPKRYADTFDDLGRFIKEGPLSNISAQVATSWKQWMLLNPLRAVKYMLNNLSGDLDIVIAYDYHILKYIPQSFKELTAFSQATGMTEELKEFFLESGLDAGITINEIPDISKLGYFKLLTGEKPNLINRYWDTVRGFNNFRENLLRLAAYKHFKRNLLEGKALYGASTKTEIDAMTSSNQPLTSIASKLARELIGDYGNISHSGNWIRRHMVYFYSWMEINLPRYVRMAENLSAENRAGGKTRAGGAFVAGRFAKFAFFAGLMYSAVELWNRTAWKVIPGFPSPDELTDWQRKQHHVILGRRDDGSIRTGRFQGALGDALSWFGLQDLVRDVEEISEGGYETLKDKGKDIAIAPIERIAEGSRPLFKTVGEALLGKTLYPDIRNPRPIRDPWEHVMRLIDAGKPYRYIKGLPMQGIRNDIESLFFYISDPGESHYFNVKNYVRNYLDKKSIEIPAIESTKKSNALYYYKQALRYGEKEKAQEFWEEYKRLGGTVAGKEQSIRMSHPLYGVKNIAEFEASLTVEQRKEINEAEKWYRKVYFGHPSTIPKTVIHPLIPDF